MIKQFILFVLFIESQQLRSIFVDYLFIWDEHQAAKAITLGLTASDVHLKVIWQIGWRRRQPDGQPKHT
jgi:hypothetical protein